MDESVSYNRNAFVLYNSGIQARQGHACVAVLLRMLTGGLCVLLQASVSKFNKTKIYYRHLYS